MAFRKSQSLEEFKEAYKEEQEKIKRQQDDLLLEHINSLEDDDESIDTITGAERINKERDKVFKCIFGETSIKEYELIFQEYMVKSFSEENRTNLLHSLKEKNRDMMSENYCPVECMLYASRLLNTILKNNDLLMDDLARCLVEVFDYSIGMYELSKKSINNIISNWEWKQQLETLILACGKKADEPVLKFILETISKRTSDEGNGRDNTEKELKYALVRMIIYSNLKTLSSEIVRLTKSLIETNPDDLKIKNKLVNNANGYNRFGDRDVLTQAINRDTLSRMSKKLYQDINKQFDTRDINIEKKGLSNEDKILTLYLSELNDYKRDVTILQKLYDEYIYKEHNQTSKIFEEIRKRNITEFVPYLEKFLTIERPRSIYRLVLAYFCYGQLAKGDAAINFLVNQATKYPTDKTIIFFALYMIDSIKYEKSLRDTIYEYLINSDPNDYQKHPVQTSIKFSPNCRKLLKDCISNIIIDENAKPNTLNCALRNFETCLKFEPMLVNDLREKDNLFSNIELLLLDSTGRLQPVSTCSLIRIISFFPTGRRHSDILTSIIKNPRYGDRERDEARNQLHIRYNIEEPS